MFDFTWLYQFYAAVIDPNIGEGRAIIITWGIAIFIAIPSFFFHGRRQNRNFRNENSAYFHESENSALDAALNKLSCFIDGNGREYRRPNHSEIVKFKEEIGIVLNHFEIVAIGVRNGFLSEHYIINSERSRLIRSFMCLSPTVQDVRSHFNNSDATKNFEILFIRIFFPHYRIITSPIEFFTPRTFFLTTWYLFRIEYFLSSTLVHFIVGGKYSDIVFSKKYYLDSNWLLLKSSLQNLRRIYFLLFAIMTPLGIFHYYKYISIGA